MSVLTDVTLSTVGKKLLNGLTGLLLCGFIVAHLMSNLLLLLGSEAFNGIAHGPNSGAATCEVRMRSFHDGETIVIEPFRAASFPVIKDLVVDRAAFDRIMEAGGYVSINTGSAPEANAIPVQRTAAESAMDAASCIGCAACVAACPNAFASLFTAAKISQYALLPQGRTEAARRVVRMVEAMDAEGFGNCSHHGECEAVCPKEISIFTIGRMRREYLKAVL
jgi:succinate dehydrogenase / fumarate reductase iron-sulfur subunit